MSEVQHPQQSYQPNLNGHQAPAPVTTGQPNEDTTVSSLPPLQVPTSDKHEMQNNNITEQKDISSNPPHPNAKTTTLVSANGATTSKTNISAPVCKNCKTSTTPLWRRDESGQVLCNACGLFLKLHGRPRPISLKTDVIKSRNRVKNSHSASSNGTSSNPGNTKSGSDTPELKAKDSKKVPSKKEKQTAATTTGSTSSTINTTQAQQSASPHTTSTHSSENQDSSQPLTSPGLVPLLPRGGQDSTATASSTNGKPTPNFYAQFHHLLPHLQQHQNQQQVPLHHPSSVPTQFASNLEKITSPLLLSTTPKQHAQVSHLSQANAAAALENLSHSKPTANDLKELKRGDKTVQPFSPATALNGSNGLLNPQTTGTSNSATKLPSLMNPITNFYSSPSFGRQHSLTNPSAFSLSKPSESSSATTNNNNNNNNNIIPALSSSSGESVSSATMPLSAQSSKEDSPAVAVAGSGEDPVALKTRISELELVNDLYKSKIQELESSESQYRHREGELLRRIHELEDLEKTRKKIKLEEFR